MNTKEATSESNIILFYMGPLKTVTKTSFHGREESLYVDLTRGLLPWKQHCLHADSAVVAFHLEHVSPDHIHVLVPTSVSHSVMTEF